jgi:glycolate oxidase
MRAVKYGTTKDYVKAMTVVLANGEILELGSAVTKTSSGYNLMSLMVGSEGTLGIISQLTLKLIPAPKYTLTLMAPFEDLQNCIAVVPKLRFNRFHPQALEFFEKEILISSEEYIGTEIFPKKWQDAPIGAYLMVSFDGESLNELDQIIDRAGEFLLSEGALEVFIADTGARLKSIWAARSSFLESIEESTKLLDECDVVVPVNKIADFVHFVEELKQNYDFEVKYFGHAGDGNLHIYTCSNDMEKDEFNHQVNEFFQPIYTKAMELDGQISGEHGVGLGKVDFLKNALGDTNIALQQGIKKVFDPKMILNPGKILKNDVF